MPRFLNFQRMTMQEDREISNLTLGEYREIALKYANGNLSGFVRTLIKDYHLKKLKCEIDETTERRIGLFQSLCIFFLGITLFVSIYGYYMTTVYSLITLIMLSLSVFSLVIISLFLYMNLLQIKRSKKVVS